MLVILDSTLGYSPVFKNKKCYRLWNYCKQMRTKDICASVMRTGPWTKSDISLSSVSTIPGTSFGGKMKGEPYFFTARNKEGYKSNE